MDSHKRSTQLERIEVGRDWSPAALVGRREASDRDRELANAAHILDSKTRWYITSLLMTWPRSFDSERIASQSADSDLFRPGFPT